MSRLYQKYTKDNPPIQCFMPDSTWYKGSGSFIPKGILWHDTGADNDTLRRYVQPADNDPKRDELIAMIGKNRYGNDWEHTPKQAGLNCWVGRLADGKVTTLQTGPWTKRPWGCGSGKKGQSLNDTHIQWEICQDAKKDKDYFGDVYEESIQLSAYLCKMFNIDPHGTIAYKGITVPTICCHWDAYSLGCGSGHDDIYDWSVMYDYLGIPRKSVNVNDPYNNLIFQRIRDDIAAAMIEPVPVHPDGWAKIDGKWYYYKDGKPLIDKWLLHRGEWYYLGGDGAMLTGWQKIGGEMYYFSPSGRMACGEWVDGKYLDQDGCQRYKHTAAWRENAKGKWWEDSAGCYPRSRTITIDGVAYTFDNLGYLVD